MAHNWIESRIWRNPGQPSELLWYALQFVREERSLNRMVHHSQTDQLRNECLRRFASLVECVGVKRFAIAIDVSTRQVNRILSGAQPNPIERLIRCLQASDPEVGDCVIDYVCQELGGHFVRHTALDSASVNAVRECAEAIAAISDGEICDVDLGEVRQAISALSSLLNALQADGGESIQRR